MTDKEYNKLIQPIVARVAAAAYESCTFEDLAEVAKESLITARNYGRNEQLEQVIEWLKVNTRDGNYAAMQRNHTGYPAWAEVETDELIEELTAAMRPTTPQEDNS